MFGIEHVNGVNVRTIRKETFHRVLFIIYERKKKHRMRA